MRLPSIIDISTEEDKVCLTLKINKELRAFDGHFDVAPIIPGVVQLSWAIIFADQHIRKLDPAQVKKLEVVKFQNIIEPETVLNLEIVLKEHILVFAYSNDNKKYSSGKIVVA